MAVTKLFVPDLLREEAMAAVALQKLMEVEVVPAKDALS